jgi:predicted AlkP superfamily pyrophosphatase or phosphodiesterase
MADTPCIDGLIAEGAVTWQARTVMPSVTLPCHTSMLRGVDTARHGITTNVFQPLARPVPSLLDVAYDQGLQTGFVYNWEQLRDLGEAGKSHVSMFCGYPSSAEGDTRVADAALLAMEWCDLDLLFVYFGWPDECAHRHGWMSPEYIEAISHADRCLSRVLGAIDRLGRREETTVLVTSDHGGHDRTHGTDRDEDMLVPWILSGRGVRKGHNIIDPVRVFDTCVTAASILGLTPSSSWEGRVISEAFE